MTSFPSTLTFRTPLFDRLESLLFTTPPRKSADLPADGSEESDIGDGEEDPDPDEEEEGEEDRQGGDETMRPTRVPSSTSSIFMSSATSSAAPPPRGGGVSGKGDRIGKGNMPLPGVQSLKYPNGEPHASTINTRSKGGMEYDNSMMDPTSSRERLHQRRASKSTLPILRWLGSAPSSSTHSPNHSPPPNRKSTFSLPPSPSTTSPTSSRPSTPSTHSALNEALSTPLPLPQLPQSALPTPPPHALLPPSFRPHSLSSRPPAFLDNLTRSTLPISSVSYPSHPPSPITTSTSSPYAQGQLLPDAIYNPYDHDGHTTINLNSDFEDQSNMNMNNRLSSAPIILTNSPPGRTSIDTVRTLLERDRSRSSTITQRSPHERSRSLHTQTTTAPTPFTTPWAWFAAQTQTLTSSPPTSPTSSPTTRSSTLPSSSAPTKPPFLSPSAPLVFCHGLLGFDSLSLSPLSIQVSHWRGIAEALRSRGVEVLITRVPATSSPVERARVLREKVGEVYGGKGVGVHLIGHSMGGLDCRYLTSRLLPNPDLPPSENTSSPSPPSSESLAQTDEPHEETERVMEPLPFKVLSVTTIATPHRGSSFADYFMETIGKERLPQVLGLLDLLPNGGGDGSAFEFLTTTNMKKFNEETPDVEGVKYFSWGAVYEPGLIDTWKWSHSVILEKEGPNDGLVSVASSKWGTYLGTLEQVNHLDLVGWINTARYKWAEIMGREIKFRPATFYLGIADYLAREVEGRSEADLQTDSGGGKAGKVGEGVSLVDGEGAVGSDGNDNSRRRSETSRPELGGAAELGDGGHERTGEWEGVLDEEELAELEECLSRKDGILQGRKSPGTVRGDRQREGMAHSLVHRSDSDSQRRVAEKEGRGDHAGLSRED
ncbi:hypothetical protein JAAARDRAFT_376099 [Jaapia argillacea MUCL 33604]|uniref:AB hydrolase-1 domain-containing protein n=1 Tax=Jaapia argillacea MUCL 33604 TaxID=933084 RepID=A0A067QIL9_9AGAM|nr:hypothetical protein JAAARDRAFT_376099 [Jaapia argillacea MUCL 33604]